MFVQYLHVQQFGPGLSSNVKSINVFTMSNYYKIIKCTLFKNLKNNLVDILHIQSKVFEVLTATTMYTRQMYT